MVTWVTFGSYATVPGPADGSGAQNTGLVSAAIGRVRVTPPPNRLVTVTVTPSRRSELTSRLCWSASARSGKRAVSTVEQLKASTAMHGRVTVDVGPGSSESRRPGHCTVTDRVSSGTGSVSCMRRDS